MSRAWSHSMRRAFSGRPAQGWHPAPALLLALVLVVLAMVPAVNSRFVAHFPIHTPVLDRLPPKPADASDPPFGTPIDLTALSRAGAIMPHAAPYYVHAPLADVVLQYDLRAATALYLPFDVPVAQPSYATWVLSYHSSQLLPPGLRIDRVFRLGPRILLVKVQR